MTPETRATFRVILDSLEEVAKQIIVETHRAIAAKGDVVGLVRHYDELDTFVDNLKDAGKPIAAALSSLTDEQIPEFFLNAGVKSPFTVDGVGTLVLSSRWSATMKPVGSNLPAPSPADRERGMDWVRANASGLITETVNARTLASFAKERALEGNDLPEDIFTVTSHRYAYLKGRGES